MIGGKQMSRYKKPLSFSQREFRSAMGKFTTGVTIITACQADKKPIGITINSFNSVSLDPPLVLWSLSKSSNNLAAFKTTEYWAVHILSHKQMQLADNFSKTSCDKFANLDPEKGVGEIPLLADCSARMECKTIHRYKGGDHIIIVGEVIHLEYSDVMPLAYQNGKYTIAAYKDEIDIAKFLPTNIPRR